MEEMRLKIVALFLLCAVVSSENESSKDYRKHYGLSFNKGCRSYQRVFKCMSSCKAMGFQVFRLNRHCRCTCHQMKTTTILPFFKWRTNGTTRAVPSLFSVPLYHIVGTLSPQPTTTSNVTNVTAFTCPEIVTTPSGNDTNTNSTGGGGNETTDSNGTSELTTNGGDSNGSSTGGQTDGSNGTTTAAPTTVASL